MRVGNVKEIVFSKDPKQMNWLREDFPYAEVKCPPEFSAEVQNEKDGDVLTTKIVVSYNGAHPYFTNAGSIGVSFPLQDRYTDSVTAGITGAMHIFSAGRIPVISWHSAWAVRLRIWEWCSQRQSFRLQRGARSETAEQ